MQAEIELVVGLTENLVPKMEDVKTEDLGDMVDQEMQSTMELVEIAARRIEVRVLSRKQNLYGGNMKPNFTGKAKR